MKQTTDLRKVFGVILSYESEQNPSGPFEMEMLVEPGAMSAIHIHPQQEETYEVLEGELEINLNGSCRKAKAGDQVFIPPASKHAFKNSATQKARAINRHIPGLRTREYFETLETLIKDGKVTGTSGFRNSIYLSLHTLKYADVLKLLQPPEALLKAAAIMGKLLQYKI